MSAVLWFVGGIAVGIGLHELRGRRRPRPSRDEGGIVLIEWLLGLALILLPAVGVAGLTVSWAGRINAAGSAAYEAAHSVVTSPAADEGTGRQRAVEVWTNHGYDAGDISVSFSGDPTARGEDYTATVTVTLPAVRFPGVGEQGSISWSFDHTQRVPDFRSVG